MTYFPCEDEHTFLEVTEYGVTSHYVCKYCKIKVSEEAYDELMNTDEEEEEEEEEYDIVDDDDMC